MECLFISGILAAVSSWDPLVVNLLKREYKERSFLSKEKKCDDRGRSSKPSS